MAILSNEDSIVKQLNGLDGIMMIGDMFNFPIHIGALFIYDPSTAKDGQFGFEQAQDLLLDIIDRQLPILKCKAETLVMSVDNPYWVTDEKFSLDNHLERVALDAPADWSQLYRLAETFHARPLAMDKPLWEAMFIEGLDHLEGHKKGSVGMLLKIHHAVADGRTAMRLFNSLHTLSPEVNAERLFEEAPEQDASYEKPGLLSRYSRAYWHNLQRPVQLTSNLTRMVPSMIRSRYGKEAEKPMIEEASGVPETVFNSMPSADRVVGHVSMKTKDVRKLSSKADCTINDIALAVIGGAMREWMLANDQLPEKSIVAGVPIDTRGMNANHDVGNQFNVAMIKLGTQIESPKYRLQAIRDAANTSKSSSKKMGPKAFKSIIDGVYPAFLQWGAARLIKNGAVKYMPPIVNTLASNVPGLQAPVYLCGAKLTDYIGLGFLAPTMTLFHVISSTEERINISFVGCPDSLSDPDGYCQALQDSFKALQADIADNS